MDFNISRFLAVPEIRGAELPTPGVLQACAALLYRHIEIGTNSIPRARRRLREWCLRELVGLHCKFTRSCQDWQRTFCASCSELSADTGCKATRCRQVARWEGSTCGYLVWASSPEVKLVLGTADRTRCPELSLPQFLGLPQFFQKDLPENQNLVQLRSSEYLRRALPRDCEA